VSSPKLLSNTLICTLAEKLKKGAVMVQYISALFLSNEGRRKKEEEIREKQGLPFD
jgi:hypothetical protein